MGICKLYTLYLYALPCGLPAVVGCEIALLRLKNWQLFPSFTIWNQRDI